MRNNRDFSDKNENEVNLKKGGKFLLRKINIDNLKNYSRTPKENNKKKLFNDGIIERFFKKKKKKKNNKSNNSIKKYKNNVIKRNNKKINDDKSNDNNSFNNDNHSSLQYNKSFVDNLNHTNLISQNNNKFINYFAINNKSNIHNYNPEEIVTVQNKINNNDKKVKYLIPIYDNNNKYIGLYKDLNFKESNQNLNLKENKNTTKSSNEIDKLNNEIIKLKQQQDLDKQELDNKLKLEIRNLKNSLRKKISKVSDKNDLNYIYINEPSENLQYDFEDSNFFQDEYKLYKNYKNNNLKIPKYKSFPKIISQNNNKNLFRNSFNYGKKKKNNFILSHSQSSGSIHNYQYKLNRNNLINEFNYKNNYNLPNIRYQNPNNDGNIYESSQSSKSTHAKKFRRFKINKIITEN